MVDRLVRIAALLVPLLAVQPVLAKEATTKAPATSEAPAASPAAPAAKQPSPGQTAARDRQKKCGAEWRGLTDAQKTAQGPKWPQFWSKCNKRLKGNDKA
ncbi:hypothetical protein GOFOIKOB_4593 [Methylobacterium tardum]|jgi:hypothetical protein|uniref:Phosphate starvation-inducible protein PsiF n=1 Tax=Methylobacterium tardum TaxID=374432 RepID=A0AA37WTR6_9HYPH|nr:hypothetical protein [Methylobacterium tardum]URD39970.1 hypothetical protein M6G65_13890 [Methylobacterium tardum]GJE51533.1 hypothetical protein GOFOIKOB_4593 [Methylobacterium tardum]GLS73570.1 hypothetical protein GCM10007890_55850 [Methylobacterium tardum]